MFRFTIRDVLWLTVVVALGAGWWIDHRTIIKQKDTAISAANALLGMIESEKDVIVSVTLPDGSRWPDSPEN